MDESILSYVDASLPRFLQDLQRLIRQPSVTAQKEDVANCAQLLMDMMDEVGIETHLIPMKEGNPVLVGEAKG